MSSRDEGCFLLGGAQLCERTQLVQGQVFCRKFTPRLYKTVQVAGSSLALETLRAWRELCQTTNVSDGCITPSQHRFHPQSARLSPPVNGIIPPSHPLSRRDDAFPTSDNYLCRFRRSRCWRSVGALVYRASIKYTQWYKCISDNYRQENVGDFVGASMYYRAQSVS